MDASLQKHPNAEPNVADLMVFTGNSNPALVEETCKYLSVPVGRAQVKKFSDGEIAVELQENVRGRDVFIVQSTCAPTNDNLMEMLVLADALRRASAARITAVIPYFGYARQDRRVRSARVPITAKVIADMIVTVRVDRVLTIDLHAEQIQGFFDVPVDNIYGTPILLDDMQKQTYENLLVVSPDIGGVVRARAFAKLLGTDLAIIDKRRPKANVAEVMNIIGEVNYRYRRNAMFCCNCTQRRRRNKGNRLLYSSGFIRQGYRKYQQICNGRIGGNQQHTSFRRGSSL
jgi:ribose-phosphate pyrophosphokinase